MRFAVLPLSAQTGVLYEIMNNHSGTTLVCLSKGLLQSFKTLLNLFRTRMSRLTRMKSFPQTDKRSTWQVFLFFFQKVLHFGAAPPPPIGLSAGGFDWHVCRTFGEDDKGFSDSGG